MDFSAYCGDVLRSLGFLSRLPVPARLFEGRTEGVAAWSHAFPLAGLLIALPGAILLILFGHADADPFLAALIVLAVQVFVTGALHEDGFADSADGLFGGRDKSRALEIMKDSRIGSYGASALFFSFAIRAAALAAIIRTTDCTLTAPAALLAIAAASRAALVWHWNRLPPAKTDGIAAGAGSPDRRAMALAVLIGGGIALALLWTAFGLGAALIALAAILLAAVYIGRLANRKIGGHTGDTIGACQQLCEIVGLSALALAA